MISLIYDPHLFLILIYYIAIAHAPHSFSSQSTNRALLKESPKAGFLLISCASNTIYPLSLLTLINYSTPLIQLSAIFPEDCNSASLLIQLTLDPCLESTIYCDT